MAIDLNLYARMGAQARVNQIETELEEIRRAFPSIGGARRGRPAASVSAVVEEARPRRTRRPMNAAQKKAVGIRMKAYWAARRKAKKTQG